MKTSILILFLSLSTQALAWDKSPKLPDATKAQCEAEGKTFMKHSVRKNGSKVRAYCRKKTLKKVKS